MAESPFTTPKRKRGEMLSDDLPKLNTTTQFTFDVNSSFDDGNASPRTRVAHRFRGLALGGGGGVSGPPADQRMADTDDADSLSRKRVKFPDVEMHDADDPIVADLAHPTPPTLPHQASSMESGSPSRQRPSSKSVRIALDDSIVKGPESIAHTSAAPDEDTSVPSLTPPSPPPASASQPQSRTRAFQRAGTPPYPTLPTSSSSSSTSSTTTTAAAAAAAAAAPTSTNPRITDPVRASLTWHDDEITIYDPDDSDDDGTGINGIGFKPTPAIAYARTVRRRQQLAEYKKREEREARAKRSLRRRGGSPAPGLLETAAAAKKMKGERRRVRFLEGVVAGGSGGGGGGNSNGTGAELIGV